MSPLLIGLIFVIIMAIALVIFPRLPVSLIRRLSLAIFWTFIGVVASILLLRGLFFPAVIVVLLGFFLSRAIFAPRIQSPSTSNQRSTNNLSSSEAREILGLGPHPNRADIEAAYKKLIKKVHPDHGGSGWLAERLTAARDKLLSELDDPER